MLICFCTPYGSDFTDPAVKTAKYAFQTSLPEHSFTNAEITLNVVSLARNSIVEAVPADVDVTFWVDSDVIIPPETTELLNFLTDDTPVVSGIYVSRRFPHFPQIYNKAAVHGQGMNPYLPVVEAPVAPTYYDAIGAGFMMVKRWVFDELQTRQQRSFDRINGWMKKYRGKKDTIEWAELERAVHVYESLKPWFEFLGRVGEDFYFCQQLERIGIRPLVVPIWAEHVGLARYSRAHFDAMRSSQLHYISTIKSEGEK